MAVALQHVCASFFPPTAAAFRSHPLLMTLDTLPEEVLLHILGFLDPRTICVLSCVCRRLRRIASDNLLWRSRLFREMPTWECVAFNTQPGHHDVHCDAKKAYLRGSPYFNAPMLNPPLRTSLSQRLPFPFMRQTARVVLCGPGLDGAAEGMVGQCIWGQHSPFRPTGLFPGADGAGAGIGLCYGGSFYLNLIVLYRNTYALRQTPPVDTRLQTSETSLHPRIASICHLADAFIYVVDAGSVSAPATRTELQLLLSANSRRSPVLILVCHQGQPQMTCSDAASAMALETVLRPWQIRSIPTDEGPQRMGVGLQWLQQYMP
eukprot:m.123601 g.123601  ORF g.123601 m.123601 type:complete len:320 (+) comp14628_c0_seq1:169-1128(+)